MFGFHAEDSGFASQHKQKGKKMHLRVRLVMWQCITHSFTSAGHCTYGEYVVLDWIQRLRKRNPGTHRAQLVHVHRQLQTRVSHMRTNADKNTFQKIMAR